MMSPLNLKESPMSDPNTLLRDDVRLLGNLLGEVLSEQRGPAFLENVESVRKLSKSSRAGDKRDFEQLLARLKDLSAEEMIPLCRAFSQFLTLANFAESHHRIRRR